MATSARTDAATPLRIASLPGVTLTEGLHPAGTSLPWHSHAGPSICLVLEGAFVEYYRGVALDCRPSSLKFTPAGERHWNRFHLADVRGLLIEIDLARHRSAARFEQALSRSAHFGPGPELLLARRLHAEFRSADSAAPLAVEGLLLELLALVARGTRGERHGTPAWARRAYELLEAGYVGTLSLGVIASEVGVHPATLARGFRRAYGCTVGEMQRHLRLDLAARQLEQTELPLAAIAQEAGFYDQSHFSNSFRRHFGFSPLRYRRARRAGA
ncbi:MAG TPA: helix-turn-helix transcriptional regulator [Gemmatimonadales bacterium]|nr:helix-turn-helix transcriptional regulator [Gemmatimonadales bacterium]